MSEVDALRGLRSAYVWLFLASAAYVAGVFAAVAAFLPAQGPADFYAFVFMLLAAGGVLWAVLGLKFYRGFKRLARIDGSFDACAVGSLLSSIGGAASAAVGAFGAYSMRQAASALEAVAQFLTLLGVSSLAGLLSIVGYVLAFVLSSFRLHARYRIRRLKIAGVLYAASILIPILAPVSAVLVYTALGRALTRLSTTDTNYETARFVYDA
ncbi:MAG: DUF973 family protein [Thermofilaceae archaeon]